MICRSSEILDVMDKDHFAGIPKRPEIVRFVSVIARRPRSAPHIPLTLPSKGKWLVKILGRDDRFVFGVYRRHMKVIGYLGSLDRLFGAPATTRNWNTLAAVASVLEPS
jgi:hypothetical protein